VAHDIRYKGLEFDGWRELHWTRPFRGERYSLVWYTPQGLEEPRAALDRGEGWEVATRLAEGLSPVEIVTKSLANLEAARAARTPLKGALTAQRFSMVPPNVNFKSKISMLAIERLDRVGAFNVQVSCTLFARVCMPGCMDELFKTDACERRAGAPPEHV
jgi:hypothetical protein